MRFRWASQSAREPPAMYSITKYQHPVSGSLTM
jgi:hypothetical protein